MEDKGDMNKPINKMDRRYIAACIQQLPTLADPEEVGIIRAMENEALSTPFGKKMIDEERQAVKSSLRDLLAHLGDSSYAYTRSRQAVAEIARIVSPAIVSGREKLGRLEKGKPVFFSANHLGLYKLMGLSPEDLAEIGFKAEHEIPDIYYSPIPFYASLYPVAKELGDDIYMAAFEEPGKLGELSRSTGYIDVPPSTDMLLGFDGSRVGRIDIMTEESGKFFEKRANSAILVFPEGGTTGKRNGGRIYDLGEFHTGLFVIASRLEVPIVILAHRFNPDRGFEIAIADVMHLDKGVSREEIQEATINARMRTQAALDQLRVGGAHAI